jgi:hypothetical protein
MKFRTVVFLFIVIILLIGAFTKPGPDAFKEYYSKQYGISSPPMIEYTNGIAYSIFAVTNFAITSEGKKQVAVKAGQTKYLGLFGRFWKID